MWQSIKKWHPRATPKHNQNPLNLVCHKVAENNEATAPQIAAQSPSDKSEISSKYAPVFGQAREGISLNGSAHGLQSFTRCAPRHRILLSTSPSIIWCAPIRFRNFYA
jgi:hypothetical protein